MAAPVIDHMALKDAQFILVPQYFGSTVFNRHTSKYLPFDIGTTALLRHLKDVPFNIFLQGVDDPAYKEQLILFFEDFYRIGFFTYDLKFSGVILDVTTPGDHLVGPLALHLEVLSACNLACTHCFAGALPRKEVPLTLKELDGLFATLVGMGTFRLGLTGGEPLMRRDLFDIVDLAAAKGLHSCITTNGLLITEDIAKSFGKRKLVWLNVSLEGATAEVNDLVRGKGVFDRVVKNLSTLSKHTPFTLAFTIMKSNLHQMEACVDLACKVGAQTAVFRPLYPVGTAQHNLDLMPSFEDYTNALNTISRVQEEERFELCSIDPFSPHARLEKQSVVYDNNGCGAGNTVCSVSVSGEVNPCSFLGVENNAANIRQQPFEEIWNNSQRFTSIRDPVDEQGNEKAFKGGCRARALVFNGDIDAKDPWLTGEAFVNQLK